MLSEEDEACEAGDRGASWGVYFQETPKSEIGRVSAKKLCSSAPKKVTFVEANEVILLQIHPR